jgi:hypothetical protein
MVDTKMAKSSGEFWVASVLSRYGWGAALTRDGLERTDILAVKADDTRQMIEVQVKAAQETGREVSWPVNGKSQLFAQSSREWFVFVALPPVGHVAPRSFIVPRDHVSAAAWLVHTDWLTEPGIPAGQRNAPVERARVSEPTWAGYEDRWDLLDSSALDAPVLLPAHLRRLALDERVGLPPGHPWNAEVPTFRGG